MDFPDNTLTYTFDIHSCDQCMLKTMLTMREDPSTNHDTLEGNRKFILAYLLSSLSYSHPRALELLYRNDGRIDHRIYWQHLKDIAEIKIAKKRLSDWLAQYGLFLSIEMRVMSSGGYA